MRATFALAAATLFATAQAHFTLNYPSPRGAFDEDKEPNFCGGYNDVNTTRTSFPLSGGTIAIDSHHPQWNLAVFISTKANPSSPGDFNTSASGGQFQYAVPPSQQSGEGVYCFTVDASNTGLSEIKDGANATFEIAFDGGDGLLYQCADITFSSSAKSPSDDDLKCQTVKVPDATAIRTGSASASSTSGSSSSSATAPAASSPAPSNAAVGVGAPALTGLFAVAAAFFAL